MPSPRVVVAQRRKLRAKPPNLPLPDWESSSDWVWMRMPAAPRLIPPSEAYRRAKEARVQERKEQRMAKEAAKKKQG